MKKGFSIYYQFSPSGFRFYFFEFFGKSVLVIEFMIDPFLHNNNNNHNINNFTNNNNSIDLIIAKSTKTTTTTT